jgi:hypothetical protein
VRTWFALKSTHKRNTVFFSNKLHMKRAGIVFVTQAIIEAKKVEVKSPVPLPTPPVPPPTPTPPVLPPTTTPDANVVPDLQSSGPQQYGV